MGITIEWLKKYPYITHVYKCYSAKKNKCKVCINWLEQEKRYFKNKIIITFGDIALSNLVNHNHLYKKGGFKEYIQKFNIFPKLKDLDTVVIPLIHPSWHNDKFIKENSRKIEWILKRIYKYLRENEKT